jgi:hypothetical protein
MSLSKPEGHVGIGVHRASEINKMSQYNCQKQNEKIFMLIGATNEIRHITLMR